MFFALSKVLWWIVEPANALLIGLVLGVALLWTRWRRAGRAILTLVALAGLAAAILPIGTPLIQALENRFPTPAEMPARVDGIVVLGGMIDPALSRTRGQIALTDGAERLFALLSLAHRYPEARVVFSGGSGRLFDDTREADVLAPFLAGMGLPEDRILFDNESRNTFENAVFSYEIAQPKAGEAWLLVTSAFHMPRAVGCFRRAGWTVVPFPVDYTVGKTAPWRLSFSFAGGLGRIGQGLHEWLGLIVYRLSGRTSALFPDPAQP